MSFLSTLNRPMGMNFRAGGMGPPGAAVHNFSGPAAPGSMGMGMGGSSSWVPGQTGFYDQGASNGRATTHESQITLDWEMGDTGEGQPTWGRTPPPGAELATEKRLNGQEMFGLPMMNWYFKYHPEGRAFGRMRSALEVQKHWNYKGVQIGVQAVADLTVDGRGSQRAYSVENAFNIQGRTRVQNLWLAQSKERGHVGQGMQCHLLLRRHRFTDDKAAHAAAWRPSDATDAARKAFHARAAAAYAQTSVEEKLRAQQAAPEMQFDDAHESLFPEFDAAAVDDLETPGFGAQTQRIDEGLDYGDNTDADEPGARYFWAWDPYVSDTGTNPDPELYVNRDGRGTYLPIGMVHHSLKGTNNYTAESTALAREGIYPKERGVGYQKAFYSLDAIELHLRAAQKFT